MLGKEAKELNRKQATRATQDGMAQGIPLGSLGSPCPGPAVRVECPIELCPVRPVWNLGH